MKILKTAADFFRKNYFLATGLLIPLSVPMFDVWFMKAFPLIAWFAQVPLFLYVRGKPLKHVLVVSYAAGLIGNFLAYEWIGNFAGGQPGGYAAIVGFLIPSLTVFYGLKVFIAELLSREHEKLRYFIYPAVWVTVEFIQSIGYIAFPWVNVGHSQYQFIPFIQSASIFGILGIDFIMIMFSSLFAASLYVRSWKKVSFRGVFRFAEGRLLAGLVAVVIALTVWGLFRVPEAEAARSGGLRVTLVQSCISPWVSWTRNRGRYLSELKKYTDRGLENNPDLVVWSESATLESISYDYSRGVLDSYEFELLRYTAEKGVPIVTGEIGIIPDESGLNRRYPQNNAVILNADGSVGTTYSKMILVPFGEWFPYSGLPVVGPMVSDLLQKYGGSTFVPGTEPVLFDIKGKKFGVLVCYEGIFYRHCRKYKELGADFLVNITNDGWTDKFRGHVQHYSASVFRTVENGLWMVRAGNTGYTAIVDPYGREKASIPILQKGQLTGDMDFSMNTPTVYSKFGWIIEGAIFVFAGMLLLLYAFRRMARLLRGSVKS